MINKEKIKKHMKLYIFGILLVLVGLVLWNVPGVKSRRFGNQCDKQYNAAISKTGSESLKSTFETARDVCYTNIARKYQNTQLCDRIEVEQIKNLCHTQTYYWNKSVEFCEADDQRNICLDTQAIKTHDKSICDKISHDEIRENCFRRYN